VRCVLAWQQSAGLSRCRQVLVPTRNSSVMSEARCRCRLISLFPFINVRDVLPAQAVPLPGTDPVRIRAGRLELHEFVLSRRCLRDFLRAWVSFVQAQIGLRRGLILMLDRNSIRLMCAGMQGFLAGTARGRASLAKSDNFPILAASIANGRGWLHSLVRERGMCLARLRSL
jgi:hypothetical protein